MKTSQRIAGIRVPGITVYLTDKPVLTRVIAVLLQTVALLMSGYYFGVASGVLVVAGILMVAGSLCVILIPFRFIGYRHLSLGYVIFVLLELFLL